MKSVRLVMLLILALGLASAGSAHAHETIDVSIQPPARLLADGTVRVVVGVSCDPGDQVLEARLSLSQDEQAIFGEAGIPVRCDGRSRRYQVAVSPLAGTFHAGDAFASAFVLTCTDPTCGTTRQGSDAGTITIR